MRIHLAFDAFKGTLSAAEACRAVALGLAEAQPAGVLLSWPLADGGEGTARRLAALAAAPWRSRTVTGPLPNRPARAGFALDQRRSLAWLDAASACGLPLLAPAERDPRLTTSRGVGELLEAARLAGATALRVGIGGTATVDGGCGAATALGWRFLDAFGSPLPPGGAALRRLARIVPPRPRPTMAIEALCDVENPLDGANGAAAVFAPQKGADPATVEVLREALENLATRAREDLGLDLRGKARDGAGGGLGAGLRAFFGARLVAGAEAVLNASGLPAAMAPGDWVITGEGRLDETSFAGKVVGTVSELARRRGARLAYLVGTVEGDWVPPDDRLWEAAGAVRNQPFDDLREAARRLGHRLSSQAS
ncbi:MAG: glycerate kinase [Acidobacteriota bacterium]